LTSAGNKSRVIAYDIVYKVRPQGNSNEYILSNNDYDNNDNDYDDDDYYYYYYDNYNDNKAV